MQLSEDQFVQALTESPHSDRVETPSRVNSKLLASGGTRVLFVVKDKSGEGTRATTVSLDYNVHLIR